MEAAILYIQVKPSGTSKSGSRNTKECQLEHLKETLSTSVRHHMFDCNHLVAWDDFKGLGRECNHWLLEIKEILFIRRDRPSLNKNI